MWHHATVPPYPHRYRGPNTHRHHSARGAHPDGIVRGYERFAGNSTDNEMKYKYFSPDVDETIDDAQPVTKSVFVQGEFVDSDDFTDDVEYAAEIAAEEYHPHAEWHDDEHVFAIVDEDNNVTNVSVEIEYAPTFTGWIVVQK